MPIIIFEIENVNIEEAELTDGGGEMDAIHLSNMSQPDATLKFISIPNIETLLGQLKIHLVTIFKQALPNRYNAMIWNS